MERWNIRKGQTIIFVIGWIAYASTYFLRKPLGVVSVLALCLGPFIVYTCTCCESFS